MRDSEDSGNIIKSPSNQDLAIKISFSDESVKATKLDEVTKFPNENNKFTDSIIGTSTVVAAKTPPLGGDERSGQRCVSHTSNFMFHSSHIFFPFFFRLTQLALQNVNKDYIIFSYFRTGL